MTIQELNAKALRQPAAPAPIDLPVSECVFVAFDTETTGLSPVAARLVELSGVKFTADGREISTFQALINPETPIPAAATMVHGITDKMVANQPTADVVVPQFIAWAADPEKTVVAGYANETVLIAHNAPFDLGFLEIALCKLGAPVPSNIVLDTLPLSRALLPDAENYQLKTLVEHLGVGTNTYHRALDDSYHVQHVFLKLLNQFSPGASIADLVLTSGKLHFIDRSGPEDESRWVETAEYVTIRQAIDNGSRLQIEYSGMRKTQRVVTPLSVLFTRGTPYLTAFCHNASAERTFRIDRIVRIEVLEEKS